MSSVGVRKLQRGFCPTYLACMRKRMRRQKHARESFSRASERRRNLYMIRHHQLLAKRPLVCERRRRQSHARAHACCASGGACTEQGSTGSASLYAGFCRAAPSVGVLTLTLGGGRALLEACISR